jgi:hypothetical protein
MQVVNDVQKCQAALVYQSYIGDQSERQKSVDRNVRVYREAVVRAEVGKREMNVNLWLVLPR